jgi:hypothetical protein
VRYPVSKTGGSSGLGGSTPSPSAWRHGRVERQRVATARAGLPLRRFESCCLRLSFRRGRAVRRATVTREAQVRSLPPESPIEVRLGLRRAMMTSIGLHALVVELEMTPDSQSGSCGFESRRGFRRSLASACRGAWPPRRLWAPEIAGSTPAGQTCAVEEGLSSRAS